MSDAGIPAENLVSLMRFGLNSPNAARLADFYACAFGATVRTRRRLSGGSLSRWDGIRGGADCTIVELGDSVVEIWQFDHAGRPMPQDLPASAHGFQHFAIVVSDMRLAIERLMQAEGWRAITRGGPQCLPASAGGVTAFKFRDPDGHPLELLEFPTGRGPSHWRRSSRAALIKGIDHSAVSVADVERSIAFYTSRGLAVANQTLNHGVEQARLDDVLDPWVDVIALAPATPTPHVELLHYRSGNLGSSGPAAANDVAATRLVFSAGLELDGEPGLLFQDPDGHFLCIPAP